MHYHGDADEEIDYDGDYRAVFHDFYDLMKFRVHRILLVSSLYDAYILEEEGLLFEQISDEYYHLSLPYPPQIIRVDSGEDALRELKHEHYDLVITMARLGEMDPYEFGRRAKAVQKDIPIFLLLTEMGDIKFYHTPGLKNGIDKVFFWNGDSALYIAITKYLEDVVNVGPDTSTGLVRAILVVEDSPRFYSVFLPLIYAEIMNQTRELLSEGLNEHEKRLRIRSRPKILLAETYDEAISLYQKYRPYMMAVISDVSYHRAGKRDQEAGFKIAEEVKGELPVLLQSSHREHSTRAWEMDVPFIDKNSPTLLQEIGRFFTDRLGFGPFVFRTEDGEEVGRAEDTREFLEKVHEVPIGSLLYHAREDHFSSWLMSRGELDLARKLKPKHAEDFSDMEGMRQYLIDAIVESRREKQLGVITDFDKQTWEFDGTFTKLGGGSIGGKGRGLGFLSALLAQSRLNTRVEGARVMIPDTLIIGTDEFDRFIDDNSLHEYALEDVDDDDIASRFLKGRMSGELVSSLGRYLSKADWPIAVRSSSLLEDSQNQPFAGIYSTYMIPNNCEDDESRLEQLVQAIKLVYASTFYRRAKAYIQTVGLIQEEEKMAVVIQKLIGNKHGDRFYPEYSGVAQSYNFYPVKPLEKDDGIVSAALGLGRVVVEGEKVLTFSPAHPNVLPGFYTPADALRNSQSNFYALNMGISCYDLSQGEDVTLLTLDIGDAEKDGTLRRLASTYDPNDDRIRDGLGSDGPRVITFSGILKYESLPLAGVLRELMEFGRKGMGRSVELEFAGREAEDGHEFYVVQIRPMVTQRERSHLSITDSEFEKAVVRSSKAMGNGSIEEIRDIVYVVPETFDKTRTPDIAMEIGSLNKAVGRKPYILIGPGRWGTQDSFLGIPVQWDQISRAKAIVEYSTEDFRVDPSFGTHFFHNITALGIPYLTVPYKKGDRSIDWGWLSSAHGQGEYRYVRHIVSDHPLTVKVDGRTGRAIIAVD